MLYRIRDSGSFTPPGTPAGSAAMIQELGSYQHDPRIQDLEIQGLVQLSRRMQCGVLLLYFLSGENARNMCGIPGDFMNYEVRKDKRTQ